MSKLFQIAAQAAQRLAVREFNRTPIGKILRSSRRIATGRRGSERRMSTLLRQLSSPEARRLLDELERVGPIKYGKQHERPDVLVRFLRLLGPLGDAIRRVIGAGSDAKSWSSQQVESAKDVVRAFGSEVLTRPGEAGYERGIEAARQALSEVAEPPPFQPPIQRSRFPIPEGRPTIGETGKSQRTLDAEEALEQLLGGGQETEDEDTDEETTIQTLGRGMGYDAEDDAALISREIRVESSNVYSFVFERESHRSGILYVTFLAWTPGSKHRSGPGPTYAYYDVPLRKYHEFEQAATTNSAGGAVWDYLRVRGSVYQHQHQYRIVAGVLMQEGGQY
ncbi:MAG: hypothetical protein ACKV2Q_09540, partial [Planctomycetaceae bacterium]